MHGGAPSEVLHKTFVYTVRGEREAQGERCDINFQTFQCHCISACLFILSHYQMKIEALFVQFVVWLARGSLGQGKLVGHHAVTTN